LSTRPMRMQESEQVDLAALSLRLARIDLARAELILEALFLILMESFRTERVSIISFDGGAELFSARGFEPSAFRVDRASPVLTAAKAAGGILLVDEMNGVLAPLSPWHESYEAPGFAVFLSSYDSGLEIAVCVSNLAAQSVQAIRDEVQKLALVAAQLGQLAYLAYRECDGRNKAAGSSCRNLCDSLEKALASSDSPQSALASFRDLADKLGVLRCLAAGYLCPQGRLNNLVVIFKPVPDSHFAELFGRIHAAFPDQIDTTVLPSLENAIAVGRELVVKAGAVCPPCTLETVEIMHGDSIRASAAILFEPQRGVHPEVMQECVKAARLLLNHIRSHNLETLVGELQSVDSLTGLLTEKHFYSLAEREFDRAKRYDLQLGMMLVDIDHFKELSEAYGPEAGDSVLREMARLVGENIRGADIASRYGGERFIVILPETPAHSADLMADRIRRYIENYSFYIPNSSVFVKVTASVGVSNTLQHKPTSLAQFIEYADTALYFAKRNGRNQVVNYTYVLSIMIGETRNAG
jgi:diguanylate cyclase (GGDEF)-like protein